MIRLLCLIVFLDISATASVLDTSDVGTHVIIHQGGHVTGFPFFVSLSGDTWNTEQRKPDSSWSNVTCERDCILHASKQLDIARFFPASALADIDPSCMHNTAFAFCNYTLRSHPERKDYIFIALVTSQPTPLRLKKLASNLLGTYSSLKLEALKRAPYVKRYAVLVLNDF